MLQIIIAVFVLYMFWVYRKSKLENNAMSIIPANVVEKQPSYVDTISDQPRQDFNEIVNPPEVVEQIIPEYVREENDYVHANPDDPLRTDFDDAEIGPPLTIPPFPTENPPTEAPYYAISADLEKIINGVSNNTYTNQLVSLVNATPTKKIVFVKDTTNTSPNNQNDGWRTFQIAEVKAYSLSRLLTQADYESASYEGSAVSSFPAMNALDGSYSTFSHTWGDNPRQSLVLTLKSPQLLSEISIINRQDECCKDRLNNTLLLLLDEENNPFYTRVLTGDSINTIILEKPTVIVKK